jgi:class 3 adenylate cyclase
MNPDDVAFLVVDDDDNNLYTLSRQLRRMGYSNITTASGGGEAIALLEEHEFDLVLLDNMMPEVSGLDVLQHLHKNKGFAELPVIMVSALTETDSVVACIELGAEDYVPKPVNVTLLKARIEATLQRKTLREAAARQLRVIREVFGRYVPEDVVTAIVEGRGTLQPTKTVATILYADIEAFTTIAEEREPEQVVKMLNEYFPAMIQNIDEHGGSVNQFQGDALLVTFNVPVADERHADQALHAAASMQRTVAGQRFAGVKLNVRIGISTGEVIAGNVGSGERVNYTVHGDAVNVAARLEQLNKEYRTGVLVSGATAAQAKDKHSLRSLGRAAVRGKNATLEIFCLEVDP